VTFANRLTLGLCNISSSSAVKPLCVLYFFVVAWVSLDKYSSCRDIAAWFCAIDSSPSRELGSVFSFPCFRTGLPGVVADLCMMLSSACDVELPKYPSSTANVLLFPGDSGVPAFERPVFVGLPKPAGFSFMAFSKATGRSTAPGGALFLLGLPCGVETGVMKLFLVGVFGRSLKASFWPERVWRGGGGTGRISSCFPP